MHQDGCVTESDRRWDFALDQPGSIIAATVATLAFRHLQLAVFPQFATFHAGFILVVDGIAAFLLFGQFVYRPLAFYALLGAAYLCAVRSQPASLSQNTGFSVCSMWSRLR